MCGSSEAGSYSYALHGFQGEVFDALCEEFYQEVKPLLPSAHHYDRLFAARFLKARKGDRKEGRAMLEASLAWRRENNVDAVLEEGCDPRVVRYFPHGFAEGTDLQGHPIYFERSGAMCLPGPEVISLEELTRWKIWISETLDCKLRSSKEKTALCILDMQGLTMGKVTKHIMNFMKMTGEVQEKNYPETLYKILIINSGVVFQTVWKMVKYFFAEEVREKVSVIPPSDYPSSLYQFVSPDVLPKFIEGGKWDTPEEWAGDLSYMASLPWDPSHEGLERKEAIKAGGVHEHRVQARKAETISWAFLAEKHNIEFSLVSPTGNHVVAPVKVEKGVAPAKGTHNAQCDGTYTLVFSNKFSWTTSKVVRYTVKVLE